MPPACGNGIIGKNEECDCTNLGGNTCIGLGFPGGELSCRRNCTFDTSNCFLCGNGITEGSEQCDDGNIISGDGCSESCQLEAPVWGNNILEQGEECDDGNNINGDGCSSSCLLEPLPNAWQPPIGIPAPEFGVVEQPED